MTFLDDLENFGKEIEKGIISGYNDVKDGVVGVYDDIKSAVPGLWEDLKGFEKDGKEVAEKTIDKTADVVKDLGKDVKDVAQSFTLPLALGAAAVLIFLMNQ